MPIFFVSHDFKFQVFFYRINIQINFKKKKVLEIELTNGFGQGNQSLFFYMIYLALEKWAKMSKDFIAFWIVWFLNFWFSTRSWFNKKLKNPPRGTHSKKPLKIPGFNSFNKPIKIKNIIVYLTFKKVEINIAILGTWGIFSLLKILFFFLLSCLC